MSTCALGASGGNVTVAISGVEAKASLGELLVSLGNPEEMSLILSSDREDYSGGSLAI